MWVCRLQAAEWRRGRAPFIFSQYSPSRVLQAILTQGNSLSVAPPQGDRVCCGQACVRCRGASLIRTPPPVGPYRRPMPTVIWWSSGGVLFLMSDVPLYPLPSQE